MALPEERDHVITHLGVPKAHRDAPHRPPSWSRLVSRKGFRGRESRSRIGHPGNRKPARDTGSGRELTEGRERRRAGRAFGRVGGSRAWSPVSTPPGPAAATSPEQRQARGMGPLAEWAPALRPQWQQTPRPASYGRRGLAPHLARACARHLQRSPLKRHVPGTSEREPVPGVPRWREGRDQGKSCCLGSGGALALTDPIAQGRHYPPPPATEPPQRPPRRSPLCLDPLPHASCGFVKTDGGLSIGSDNLHLVCLRLCPGLLRQRLSGSPGEVLSTPRPSLERSST